MINHFYVDPSRPMTDIVNGINGHGFANALTLQAMNIAAAAIALGLHKNEINYFYNQLVISSSVSSEEYFELMLNTAIEIIEKRGE